MELQWCAAAVRNCLPTFSKDIADLRDKVHLPQTVIAVVGDTGSGKSSLTNALLDHAGILPTSGLRACTATVVEVSANLTDSTYQADVEFLSPSEWEGELKILLDQLKGHDGKVQSRQPNPEKQEEEVAWHKIRAVYGAFKDGVTLEKLVQKREVTRYLGKTKRLTRDSVSVMSF